MGTGAQALLNTPGIDAENSLILEGGSDPAAQRYTRHAVRIFERIKALLAASPPAPIHVRLVVPAEGEKSLFSGLFALIRSAAREHRRITGQLIEIDPGENPAKVIQALARDGGEPGLSRIRYRNGKRQAGCFRPLPMGDAASLPWKDGGVYLITGGTGGLGRLFAEEIASRVDRPIIILASRNPEPEPVLLRQGNAEVVFHQVDITREEAASGMIRHIMDQFGRLDGILHLAGVIRDSLIAKKSRRSFEETMGPKVQGLVNLDRAARDIPLDLFVLFSSVAGSLGNAGQADYACANAFMDAYALYRDRRPGERERPCRMVSVGWPLWEEGGMKPDPATIEMVQRTTGMSPLKTRAGLNAFYRILAADCAHALVVYGDENDMSRALEISQATCAPEPKTDVGRIRAAEDITDIRGAVAACVSEILGVDGTDLDDESEFWTYGFDSVTLTQLANRLSDLYNRELPLDLFFEHPSISGVADLIAGADAVAPEKTPVRDADGGGPTRDVPDPQPIRSLDGAPKIRTSSHLPDPVPAVAVIGMSGRFPGAKDLEGFWRTLETGKTAIEEIPRRRWDWRDHYLPDMAQAATRGKSCCKWGGFLEDADRFDPLFFNISPKDAGLMDPHQRLFLEECWRALEDACILPGDMDGALKKETGVFCGISKTGARLWHGAGAPVSASFSSLVNRVSFFLDLAGPSLPVDSMCSSALSALHEACQSLRRGDIRMALAGGVNLNLHPMDYAELSRLHLLSDSPFPDVLGARAKGFIPSEGVGVVVLKRLSDALREKDDILAVIRGSAVNHSGKTSAFMAPSPEKQAEVIKSAMTMAGAPPAVIGYIELAASGVPAGDLSEIKALSSVFGDNSNKALGPPMGGACRIGSVKNIFGHGEAVSGMAQLIKVILQLQYQKICPFPKPDQPIPDIGDLPFEFPEDCQAWPRQWNSTGPRRAGINNFGAGGVNVHVIVEEAPDEKGPGKNFNPSGPALFVLSARTPQALLEYARAWKRYCAAHPALDLHRAAYTLQTRRTAMRRRFACLPRDVEDLARSLDAFLSKADGEHLFFSGERTGGQQHQAAVGETLESLATRLCDERDLPALARLWADGGDIPWRGLYEDGSTPRPLSGLPVYPFTGKPFPLPGEILDDGPAEPEANSTPEPAQEKTGPPAGSFKP